MYRGGPLYKPFFIGKGADEGYIIGTTKKAVTIQALDKENLSE